jgi:uncharacterized protein YyaL (SSP411 family)
VRSFRCAWLPLAAALAIAVSAAAEKKSFLDGPLPGAAPHSKELLEKLEAKWESRASDYEPRTKHLREDGSPKYTNRLFLSSSPYLLQHAHNPVNWYPWGDEAFETAKKLGRPVLLSVGYSTCHWCHVMEEESFEDEEIARYMNEHYIAIKVDREERPDVDAIYMSAVQALTGRGGWPMTVWLTPDREPFYGGTYFPARDGDRGSRVGFLTLLQRIDETYRKRPDDVVQTASSLSARIRQSLSSTPGGDALPGVDALRAAFGHYSRSFDGTHGGMRRAPKFPSSLSTRFLLRYFRRSGDREALDMAILTLAKMAGGGMYDQVGGGFHRYSTDARWLVPHFEKMLYDNALLTLDYLEAYQVTARQDFARVAREILRYVERDMTSPEGAFYSATDADSLTPGGHREEGWFFTWTPEEIDSALGAEQSRVVKAYYAVTNGGNFEGRSILHTPRDLDDVAKELKITPAQMRTILEAAKQRLYEARARRPAPLRDEKILSAWNGLMISAYARGAFVLEQRRYAEVAARAADFVLTKMRKNGRLLRSYKDGKAEHNAYLDDHAFLTAGLLDLYEVTHDLRWLREAIGLDRVLAKHYEDKEAGGFFMISDDHEKLLAREKPGYDGAEPSGNSVHALNLLRLYELTTDDAYRKRADRTLQAFGGTLDRSPTALSEMLLALDFRTDTPKEIILVTPEKESEAEPFLDRLRASFLPNHVVAVVTGETQKEHAALVPLVKGKVARGGKATAYVCERQVCDLPTSDPAVFAKQIAKVSSLDGDSPQIGQSDR